MLGNHYVVLNFSTNFYWNTLQELIRFFKVHYIKSWFYLHLLVDLVDAAKLALCFHITKQNLNLFSKIFRVSIMDS